MKFALISDVHGNLEALESVFRDIEKQGAEKIHFLGDAVGYGCDPDKCVKLIDKFCDVKLLGNHDYALMGLESTECFNNAAKTSMEWTQSNIKDKTVSTLADFELTATFLDYFMVHSSPGEPDAWKYILSSDAAVAAFEEFSQSVCFVGHSHLPTCYSLSADGDIEQRTKVKFNFEDDKKYIINVGSVGQPRDNDPRACYLLVDTDEKNCVYRRVDYNIEKTQTKMKKAKLPVFLIDRLAMGV